MGIVRAIASSVGGTFADQWKEIVTAGSFDEYTVVAPGILKTTNRGRGSNTKSSIAVISNGSKIFVPENTIAFIFSQSGIENIITEAGGYEYQDGESSIFNDEGVSDSIVKQAANRIGFGGISSSQKEIAFVNMREIRNIRFGTRGAQVYNDLFYGCDLEIFSYGTFTVKIVDPEKFVRYFVPPNTGFYSFADQNVRAQVVSDFLQSFTVALNSMSKVCRIAELPSHANELSSTIAEDSMNAGTWEDRFGFKVVKVSIENIEFSPQSRELVNQFNENKMKMKAYDDVSQRASDIAAQQKIAEGIQSKGLGNMGGMVMGMNVAQSLNSKAEGNAAAKEQASLDEQIENVQKLKDLLDAGILTEEEFNIKKKEIMGL